MSNVEPSPLPDVLTLEQAAGLLQLHPKTVVKLATSGQLPGRRVGAQWRFSRKTLVEWCNGDRPS